MSSSCVDHLAVFDGLETRTVASFVKEFHTIYFFQFHRWEKENMENLYPLFLFRFVFKNEMTI